ncbi:MAG: phosphate uptake regulator PhoU [Candidatus Bathyarchaeota archaeon]|jgi:phosphate uptake regulator
MSRNVPQETEMRKLQVTGGSTYVLSLPKEWVTQNRLKKGSSLLIREEENGALSILPPEMGKPERPEEAFIEASPKDNPNALTRKAVAAYLVGYNIIHMKAKSQQQLSSRQRNALKNFARRLLVGTEIVTDTSTELTLQVLLSYPELSVPSALRRMCIITSSMHKDAITALKEFDSRLAEDVIATDSEVDRFHLYIIRQLKMAVQNPRIIKEIGLTNPRDCLGYRLITKTVERTADHAANIARNVLPLKKRLDEKALEKIERMSELAISSFETAIESLFTREFDIAENIIEKTKKITSLEEEAVLFLREIGIQEITNVRLIIESVTRAAEYASDIAEIVLNLTVESIVD